MVAKKSTKKKKVTKKKVKKKYSKKKSIDQQLLTLEKNQEKIL